MAIIDEKLKLKGEVVSKCPDGEYGKLFESWNLIDGWDSDVRKKGSRFQRFAFKIFVCKEGKGTIIESKELIAWCS